MKPIDTCRAGRLRTVLLSSLLALLMACHLTSCLDDDSLEHSDTYYDTFQACWETFDQHYCFFEEKGVDWNRIHSAYRLYARDSVRSQVQLFALLDQMLDTLRDGHVNLYAPFNVGRYWAWYENYLPNFDANLVDRYYLGTNFWSATGLQFTVFPSDTVAYVRYSSFGSTIGATNLDYVLVSLRNANGLIIDIRNNGGGELTNVQTLASRFATQRTHYGYIRHKTGPGHNDFSDPQPIYIDPQSDRISWDASERPVVILTNRHCYSAANNFVQAMHAVAATPTADSLGILHPKMIVQCGDRTGGGTGLPFESVLPNGWAIRFSACPMTDAQGHSTEAGIDPSPGMKVDMDSISAFEQHCDDIIEAARAYIINNTRAKRKKPENDEKSH